MAISEDEVKRSFARVKEDILQVKRSLNKQLFSLDELKKSLGGSLDKDEFYAFVKRLGSRIEGIENSFALKSDREDVTEVSSDIREEIAKVRNMVGQRDELADEIRHARALRGKVAELEGISVSKAELSKELARLSGEIAKLKASATSSSSQLSSLSGSTSKLSEDISDISAKANSLSAKAAMKDDISSFTDRIESSHREASRAFASLKRDVDKRLSMMDAVDERLSSLSDKLSAAETAISGIASSVSRKYADKSGVEKAIAELRSQLEDTKKVLESSMSEVNLDDYVSKRSLKQQLSSLSESVSSSVSSALASRLSQVEGQLASMNGQAESMQKGFEKRLEKELQRASDGKEIKRLREEIGKLVTADELYPKLERLESSTVQASDDFRKELRKQRELFEERLKLLESHYRSSKDSLKGELDDVKGQLKGLSKADEKAKVEMAKITVTAAKAAKSAADILDEVEKESPKERGEKRKGISPLVVSLLILAILIIASVAYVMLNDNGGAGIANITSNAPVAPTNASEGSGQLPPADMETTAVQAAPSEPSVSPPSEPLPNATSPEPSVPENITPSIPQVVLENVTSNATNISIMPEADNNAECRKQLECTAREDGSLWYDCYFDNSNQECRCYVGSIQNCPQFMVSNESEKNATSAEGEAKEKGGKPFGPRYYGVVAFIIVAVAFLAYRALFVRDSKEDNGKKESKPEKSEKEKEKSKERKEKASSESEKDEEGDEEIIDLEEFFEKKDKKK